MEPGLTAHVRARREAAGLRSGELAAQVGISRQALHAVETGTYVPGTLTTFRLAQVLGCGVEDLFTLAAPEVGATLCGAAPGGALTGPVRVQLAQVGTRTLAYPLSGEASLGQDADGLAHGAGAPGEVRVELLEGAARPGRTLVVTGCDPALGLLARQLGRGGGGPGTRPQEVRALWHPAVSLDALRALRRGEAHAAGIHLWEAGGGESNLPAVLRELPGMPAQLFTLWSWEQGLMVAPGNPHGISGVADLLRPGLRLVGRGPGAGSRVLLDAWLAGLGLGESERARLPGYRDEAPTPLAAAARVALGAADLAPGPRSAAWAHGLDFVPVQRERFDLVVPGEHLDHPALAALLLGAAQPGFQAELRALGGYDPAHAGQPWKSTA
ncbi:substrate-binding domain-containing protein [Deinococcus sp. Leaf326]|uniref:substrate-binding domain-containing protein n=1 Tax=Deinococcus sp. Leaf326 TaxID=1736338 RepID=UPI0007005C0A|nr:substrate-binding domain-containing protein [Deinococcus sp. Leaf326]KQR15607.1 hypothetical protein ASF71_08190 [Deinococcus sp. Leaf326]